MCYESARPLRGVSEDTDEIVTDVPPDLTISWKGLPADSQNTQVSRGGEITIMSDQRVGADRKRTGGLNGVSECQFQGSPKSSGALRNFWIQVKYLKCRSAP
jgi:hypothetical protein